MPHELFEELHAWNPQWQQRCPTVRAAAERAGVLNLYHAWLSTPTGAAYAASMLAVPDVLAAISAAQESADRLPAIDATTADQDDEELDDEE